MSAIYDFGFSEAATYNDKFSNISANTAIAIFTVIVFGGDRVDATEEISGMGCSPVIQQAMPMRLLKTGDEKCSGDQMALKRCVGRPILCGILPKTTKLFFVVFLISSRQYLKLGHGHSSNPFQFSIHSNYSITY